MYTYIPQFNMAKTIPGKEEFHETIRYFNKQLKLTDVAVRLNTRVSAQVKRPLLAYA
jgi:2,4-dienoyl-CoA reductase (NADPH2)